MHNSHTCSPAAALQIVNKIGSKLFPENFFQRSMPKAPRAYWSCGSVLEAHRPARTERFWLALIGADGKIWSAMKMLLKWNLRCPPYHHASPNPPSQNMLVTIQRVTSLFFSFHGAGKLQRLQIERTRFWNGGASTELCKAKKNLMSRWLPLWNPAHCFFFSTSSPTTHNLKVQCVKFGLIHSFLNNK